MGCFLRSAGIGLCRTLPLPPVKDNCHDRTGEPAKPPRREDWVRPARTADVLEHVARLQIPGFDVAALDKAAPSVWEYPMCDRDPLPSWRHDRVILLGDAAHPMFPIGTFGASDAVLDAAAIAGALVDEAKPIADRLTDYEQQRLPVSRRRQGDARAGGPERVLDRADALAPESDSDLDTAFPEDQRRALALATSADPNSGG